MGRKSTISIIETLDELQERRRKEKDHRIKVRIYGLILIKEQRFARQQELAEYLGVDLSTLSRWIRKYKESGLDAVLKIESGGARRNSVSPSLHEALKERVKSPTNPFRSYKEAVQWVKDEHRIELEYNTLRTYLMRHFKTKIKAPRKSHYKKDDQAEEAFKKNPRVIQGS